MRIYEDAREEDEGLGPLKNMLKTQQYITLLAKLGETWNISDDLLDQLEAFTCSMYGQKSQTGKVNDLRVTCINKFCIKTGKTIPRNVDMASLPPCRRTLEQHVRRANYQVAVWKAAGEAKPAIPSPDQDHGWIMTEHGLHPLWYEGDSLPENLQDVSEEQNLMTVRLRVTVKMLFPRRLTPTQTLTGTKYLIR